MRIQRFIITLISIGLTTLTFALATGPANDLSISNHTTRTLSFAVNGKCARDFGVVRSYGIKNIPKVFFQKACHGNYCEVMGFAGKRCTGKTVGGVKYYFEQEALEIVQGEMSDIGVGASNYNIFYTQNF